MNTIMYPLLQMKIKDIPITPKSLPCCFIVNLFLHLQSLVTTNLLSVTIVFLFLKFQVYRIV